MSALIKGMDMPTGCYDCHFRSSMIFPDHIYVCECFSEGIYGINITEAVKSGWRHPNCPLVEVPTPHGNLVDIEEVKASLAVEFANEPEIKQRAIDCVGYCETKIDAEE